MKDTRRGAVVVADDATDIKGRLVNIEVSVGLFRVGLGEPQVVGPTGSDRARLDAREVALDIDQSATLPVGPLLELVGGARQEGASSCH